MSRIAWIIIGLLVLLGVLAGGAAGGYALLMRHKIGLNLAQGEAALANGEWKKAKNHLAWYLTQRPDDVAVLMKYAEASLQLVDNRRMAVSDAGRAYFQVAKYAPDDPANQARVLEFYFQHRLWGDLAYVAEWFLRRSAEDPAPPYYRAVALDHQGRTEEAIRAYNQLIDAGAEPRDIYGNLAQLLQRQGLTAQARALLDTAEQRYPNLASIYRQRATFFRSAGDLAAAEKELARAAALGDAGPEYLRAAAEIALDKKDWDGAIALGEQLLATGADPARANLALALAYERKQEPEKALALLEHLDVMVLVDTPELLLARAEMQISLQQTEPAQATIALYRRAYPEHSGIFQYLEARELLVNGSPDEAAQKLALVIESNPEMVRAQFFQAVAYLQAGKTDLARQVLETYLRNAPDDEVARNLLKRVSEGPGTADIVEGEARALLNNPDAAPEALVRMARAVMRTAGAPGAESLTPQLVEAALAKQPQSRDAFQALADYCILRDDAPAAQRTLERVQAAGLLADGFPMLQAAVALSRKEPEQAYACFEGVVRRTEDTAEELAQWPRFFAAHGQKELALKAIEAGIAARTDEARTALEVERIALTADLDSPGKALELAGQMLPAAGALPPALQKRFWEVAALTVDRVLSQDEATGLDEAGRLLEELLRETPGNPRARLLQARLYLRQDPPDYTKAEAVAQAVLEEDRANVDALVLLSHVAALRGRYSASLEHAERAAAVAPNSRQVQLALAAAQVGMTRYREARQTLERVLQANPDDFRAMEMLARTYGISGQKEQASALIAKMEAAAGDDPVLRKQASAVRDWLAVFQEASGSGQASFDPRALAATEDIAMVQSTARALTNQGRTADAETLLKEYAAQHSDRPEAWVELGHFYLGFRGTPRLSAASSAFSRALLVSTDYAPALRGLIEVQYRSGNTGTALSLCNRYLATQPEDPDVLYRKAALLADDPARLDEALAAIQGALTQGQQPDYTLVRGLIYVGLGRYKEGVADLQQYSAAQATIPARVDVAMAEAYFHLGERELARQYFESAAQKSAKGQPVRQEHLDRLRRLFEEEDRK